MWGCGKIINKKSGAAVSAEYELFLYNEAGNLLLGAICQMFKPCMYSMSLTKIMVYFSNFITQNMLENNIIVGIIFFPDKVN